jgi:hypothetical protein
MKIIFSSSSYSGGRKDKNSYLIFIISPTLRSNISIISYDTITSVAFNTSSGKPLATPKSLSSLESPKVTNEPV